MKRIFSGIFLFTMLLSITAIPGFADADTNLLIGGTVTASSVKSSVAENAIDGNTTSTFWRTNSATTSTYTVELAEATPMDRFAVWYITSSTGGKAWRDYFIDAGGKIKVSAANDADFTQGVIELGEIPLNQDGFYFEATLKAVSKKAVRFTFESTTKVEVLVYEMAAYYTGAEIEKEPAAQVNLAAQEGAVIKGSSTNGIWKPEKVVDGLTGTGQAWQTAGADATPCLTVDFGKQVTFDRWSYTAMLTPGAASGNAVNAFVLEAADNEEFTEGYQLLYEGGAVLNSASDTVGFTAVTARYFRFRVTDRDTEQNTGFRLYEMALNIPAYTINKTESTPTVYVPADGSRLYKTGGLAALDADGARIGTNPDGSYSLTQTLDGVSICAVNGNLTVAAGTQSGTVKVKAEFSDGSSYEYDVTIDGDFAGNVSVHPSYVILNPQISETAYTMKAMTVSESAPQKLTALAVIYTDSGKTTVESIQPAETKTLKTCEYQELSFDVGAAEGRTRIFVWNGWTALQPVLTVLDR